MSDLTVDLAGKTSTMAVTFEAIQKIEAMTGLGVMTLARQVVEKSIGFTAVVAVVFAGVEASGAKVRYAAVAKAVAEAGVAAFVEPVGNYLARVCFGPEAKSAPEEPEGDEVTGPHGRA